MIEVKSNGTKVEGYIDEKLTDADLLTESVLILESITRQITKDDIQKQIEFVRLISENTEMLVQNYSNNRRNNNGK